MFQVDGRVRLSKQACGNTFSRGTIWRIVSIKVGVADLVTPGGKEHRASLQHLCPLIYSTKSKTAEKEWISFRQSRELELDRHWAFTDGSTSGWHAAVLVIPSVDAYAVNRFREPDHTRNVGAELDGLLLALEHAQAGADLTVVSDYLGIAAWMCGYWQIKDPLVCERITEARQLVKQRGLRPVFVHHGGHQKDDSDFTRWNTEADRLCSLKKKHSGLISLQPVADEE